jgi:hypothetical protein
VGQLDHQPQSPGHKGLKVTQVLTLWGIMRII